MKAILLVSCVIIAVVLFNYPVFDSKNISYLIIFLCLVVICFSAAKIRFPSDKENYESVEKEIDRQHEDDGIFQYTNDGFYFKNNQLNEYIKWDDILSVYSFSIPVLRSRQTGLEIITEKRSYEFNDENTPGITKLGDELYNHLPNWELDSQTIRSNSGLEKTKLYEKLNIQNS